MTTTALIVGAAGQDGVLLSQLLVSRGVRVVGVVRSHHAIARFRELVPDAVAVTGDVSDADRLDEILRDIAPDQVYNLAALSSVGKSWTMVNEVMAINAMGVVNLLEAVRRQEARTGSAPRFYQASSSEMFGLPEHAPQNELTRFHPRSPYAVSKLAAHHMTVNYRESYGLFACSGILYNHESPLREPTFVTRKITQGVAKISRGMQKELVLGDLTVRRDWGHARDYVEAMRLIMEHEQPDDYVVATGRSRSLREFLQTAFEYVGLTEWEHLVRSDPAFIRPVEVGNLVGDAAKARRILGWTPTVSFEQMVGDMVEADLRLLT